MKHLIKVEIPKTDNIILELDCQLAPKTVDLFIKSIPFKVGINVWGQEIYTDPSPVKTDKENAKAVVDLFDVAYWPSGDAICLFYGPTPIGTKNQIKPYSPVNVIGKIKNPDVSIISKVKAGTKATFSKA
ncbi:MAG: cyclophilin-like family protein [Candidatus Nitrosotenuis sp.]